MKRRRERGGPLAVRGYGAWLRALAWMSPARADLALARRFCTPERRAAPPAAALYAPAEPVEHRGRRLPVWRGGAGPRVLLSHGWGSHAAFWDPLAAALAEAGHEVVAFDMPAHGSAAGRRTTVFDMADALGAVGRATGPFAAVVGHSAGGAAAALALRDGLEAERAVLIAVPALPATFMFPLARALGLRHERALAALAAMEGEVGLDPFDADTVAAARELSIPGLVIHDRDDRRARWEEGREVARAWRRSTGARLVTTLGLGHYRLARDSRVIAEVVAFTRTGERSRRPS